jgi:hypothetical protein
VGGVCVRLGPGPVRRGKTRGRGGLCGTPLQPAGNPR